MEERMKAMIVVIRRINLSAWRLRLTSIFLIELGRTRADSALIFSSDGNFLL